MTGLIVFRVDSADQIGVGHIMRCLTLADELHQTGAEIHFVSSDYPGHMADMIQSHGFQCTLLEKTEFQYTKSQGDTERINWSNFDWEKDANETTTVIKNREVDWLIVDHYGLDSKWHKLVRPQTKKILVIDDLADRKYDCDILLDQTFGRSRSAYNELVPRECKLLMGTKFALLRPEFPLHRFRAIKKRKNQKQIKSILVSMGGIEPNNTTIKILKALESIQWIESTRPYINLVMNEQDPDLQSITNFSKKLGLTVNVLTNVSKMADLMLDADIAIGAGGTTSWERCCVGLPTIIIQTAKNQEEVVKKLQESGASLNLGMSSELRENEIITCVSELLRNTNRLVKMSTASFNISDGLGVKRVLEEVFSEVTLNKKVVTLRVASEYDIDMVYQWQQEPKLRQYFKTSTIPSLDEHTTWFNKKIIEPYCYFNIIECDSVSVGVLRLDYRVNEKFFMISVYIVQQFQRNGIAASALNIARRMFPDEEFRAEVNGKNKASNSLFEKAGYSFDANINCYVDPGCGAR